MVLNDPVIEAYRLNPSKSGYSGTFTLSYPTKKTCIALGFSSTKPLQLSQLKEIMCHVKAKGREKLVFYRERNGQEIKRTIYV